MDIEKEGVAIYLGGKFGRKYRIGNRLENIFTAEEAEAITENILNYYAKNGEPLERFADYVERIGFEEIKNIIADMV
jgi:dissimilatory sulfite reductase (desulfoviridin) alpha/beta subunit